MPKAIAQKSATELDLTTTFFFLLLHVTKFTPKKVQ